MKLTKDTRVCISISERPGNFGSAVFNAAFQALSLDYIYLPFQVLPPDLGRAIDAIRVFNIRGCGVSMPHKITVMKLLNQVDPAAKKIGAVNTIVNQDGHLGGFNTDCTGAQRAIEENYQVAGKKVLIIGAGGAARAIAVALGGLGVSEIYLTNRHEEAAKRVARELDLLYCSYHSKCDLDADLLVNATSVGMIPQADAVIVAAKCLEKFEAVMDVVIYPSETLLLKTARNSGKIIIPGHKMALYQAVAQFEKYTGQSAPVEIMAQEVKRLLNNS